MLAFAAYLRVYQPLAAYDGDERRHWERYLRAGNVPSVQGGMAMEQAAAVSAVAGRVPQVLPTVGPHAFVIDVDGVTLLCPWRTRVRAAAALVDFRSGLPEVLADAFAPPAAVALAEEELARWQAAQPETAVPILTATWQVPPRWFLLVDASERQVSLGSPARATTRVTGRALVYRTPMAQARRRVARGLALLRQVLPEGSVAAGVADLGRWLEEFHPRSLVELDYGGLVHLLDDAELRQDESARDVALALAALAEGDQARATAAYGRVIERGKALQGVESAN